jgi:YjbE family integral membrane protein
MDDLSAWLLVPLQILLVDLLLGADNALVIALASRRLPPAEVRQAAMIGVAGAVLIRTGLALVASALLSIPLVKLIAAAALLVIAINLIAGDELDRGGQDARPPASLWSAAAIILIADTAMSIDNVVALAAIARGNVLWLVAGVALSLPIIAFGGVMLANLLHRAPWLIAVGAALLGWIAFDMAVSDAIFGRWVEINAPALAALAPALGAGFVLLYGRWVVGPPVAEVSDLGRQRSATYRMQTSFLRQANWRLSPSPLAGEGPRIGDEGSAAEEARPRGSGPSRPGDLQGDSTAPATPHPAVWPPSPARGEGDNHEIAGPNKTPESLQSATAATEPAPSTTYDPGPEPDDHHEPPPAPASHDDRVAIIGVLLLAVAAGVILMVVSYLDSVN